mgnify:CR=1 FL=1
MEAAAAKLSTLGKYSLIASLGQGGMAKVYLALMAGPAGFNKLLVIKALREDMLSSSEEFIDMFLDEARLAARLTGSPGASSTRRSRVPNRALATRFCRISVLDIQNSLLRLTHQTYLPDCHRLVGWAAELQSCGAKRTVALLRYGINRRLFR